MATHVLSTAKIPTVSTLRCASRTHCSVQPHSCPQRALQRMPVTSQRHRFRVLATGEALDAQPLSTAVEQEDTAAEPPEEVLFEGNGAPAELLISIVLAGTILYIPLTIGAIGRRLWIKYRFTNKRFSIINTSPLFKKQVDVSYKNIKEVRAVARCFGLWGDMVIFMKDGRQVELTAVEDFREVKAAVETFIVQRP